MDIDVLAAKYGGVSRAVVTRAKENQRRAAARAPASAGLDLASPVASLVVAGRALSEPLDAKRLAVLAGVSARAVESSVQRMLVVVGADKVVKTTPAALCIRFGCEAIAEIVGRVFAEYKSSTRHHKAPPARGGAVASDSDPKEPVLVAACLYACSKQANLRVDRAKLLEFVCGYPKEFDAMVSSIESTCKTSLSGAIVPKRRGHAVVSDRASGAALADAADAADVANRCLIVNSTPPRSSSSARPTTPSSASPRRVSPRRLERMSLGSPNSQSARSPRARRSLASPSGRSPRVRKALAMPSAEEYAVWRAAALVHMRCKREEQHHQTEEVEKEKKSESLAGEAPTPVEMAA